MAPRLRIGGTLVCALLLGAVAPGRAAPDPAGGDAPAADGADDDQPVTKDPKAAKRWLAAADQLAKRGDAASKRGKVDEARSQWERAVVAYGKTLAAGDDPAVALPLALIEAKLERFYDAVRHVRALAAPGIKVKADVAKQAAARLDEWSAKVGMVTLTVVPAGATISFEGKPLGASPLPEPLVLPPGRHTVSLAADGFQPRDIELKVEAGSETDKKIELEPIPVVVDAPPPRKEAPAAPVEAARPERWPLMVGAAVGGGLVIGATVTGVLAIKRHSVYVAPGSTSDERASAKTSGQRFALANDLCLVGAVAAAAATTYYYLKVYRRAPTVGASGEAHDDVSKVDVVPWVQPESGGLVIAGQF
jgi:hypothetical protein